MQIRPEDFTRLREETTTGLRQGRGAGLLREQSGKRPGVARPGSASYEVLASGGRAEVFGACSAGTDVAEMVVAINAGGMAVREAELNRIIAHLSSGLGTGLRLEHR